MANTQQENMRTERLISVYKWRQTFGSKKRAIQLVKGKSDCQFTVEHYYACDIQRFLGITGPHFENQATTCPL